MLAINRYDEYGIPQSGGTGRFRYTGQVWLGELGMYYYKARIYSPTLGRFLQTDPIGYGEGMNWYNYVGSDPVNFSDPSGLARDRVDNGIVWRFVCVGIGDELTCGWNAIGYSWEPRVGEMIPGLDSGRAGPPTDGNSGQSCPTPPSNRPIGSTGRVGAAAKDPTGAVIANSVKSNAVQATSRLFGGSGNQVDNSADAYRHAYGAFALARLVGPGRALSILNANEVSGGGSASATSMDKHNNYVGIMMSQDPRFKGKSAHDAAVSALINGCLVTNP